MFAKCKYFLFDLKRIWYHVCMKKIVIALLVSIMLIGLQFIIAVPGSKTISAGMDTISRDAAYGFPFYFKEAYSGGISGTASNSFSLVSILANLLIIFIFMFVVLKVIDMGKRKASVRSRKA